MSVFNLYLDRAETFSVDDKSDELMIATRKATSSSTSAMNNDKMALMQDDTSYSNGDLVTNKSTGVQYFIVAKQSSSDANQCQLKRVNTTVDIVKLTPKFTNGAKSGSEETSVYSSQPAVQKVVSNTSKVFDSGLLPDTVRKFILPNLTIEEGYRIKCSGENYWVTAVDAVTYEGLLEVQVKSDNR